MYAPLQPDAGNLSNMVATQKSGAANGIHLHVLPIQLAHTDKHCSTDTAGRHHIATAIAKGQSPFVRVPAEIATLDRQTGHIGHLGSHWLVKVDRKVAIVLGKITCIVSTIPKGTSF
jgi:hypothetical protein